MVNSCRLLLWECVLSAIALAGGVLGWAGGSERLVEGPTAPPADICLVAPPTPYSVRMGVGLHEARPIPSDARCPVCGMFPARAPGWAAQVVFVNGDTQFFDSPLSLHLYLQDVGRYTPGRGTRDIAARYLRVADDARWHDPQAVVYVSDAAYRGPMGWGKLRAFAQEAKARSFIAQHGGVFWAAGDITPALLQRLDARSPHPGH